MSRIYFGNPNLDVITGTGAVTFAAPALSGTGTETFTGTGAVAISKPSLAGTGAETITGTGAVTFAHPTIAGTGAEGISGTGAVTFAGPSLAGTGAVTVIAVGGHAKSLTRQGKMPKKRTWPPLAQHEQRIIDGHGGIVIAGPSLAGTGEYNDDELAFELLEIAA